MRCFTSLSLSFLIVHHVASLVGCDVAYTFVIMFLKMTSYSEVSNIVHQNFVQEYYSRTSPLPAHRTLHKPARNTILSYIVHHCDSYIRLSISSYGGGAAHWIAVQFRVLKFLCGILYFKLTIQRTLNLFTRLY